MSRHLATLAALLPLAWGCAEHSQAWNDAWAQCEADSIKQMEVAAPHRDQRATWQDNYIRECMRTAGVEE